MPQTHTLDPTSGHDHTHTVIFLHGRDSVASEFCAELFESEASKGTAAVSSSTDVTGLELPAIFPTVRWVFPTAPILASDRFGTDMSQWFDMWSVENPDERPELQAEGLRESIGRLWKIVQEEEQLVPRSKIFLAGISQGFATVVAALLSSDAGHDGEKPFAGAIGLCGWLPPYAVDRTREGTATVPRCFRETPVFLGHAVDDEIVPIANGKKLRASVAAAGSEVSWHEYRDGGHWVNEPEGVDDIVSFVTARMVLGTTAGCFKNADPKGAT